MREAFVDGLAVCRFHVLSEFDEGKRSCRRRLAGHNERRRKPHPETHSVFGLRNSSPLYGDASRLGLDSAPFYFLGEWRAPGALNGSRLLASVHIEPERIHVMGCMRCVCPKRLGSSWPGVLV